MKKQIFQSILCLFGGMIACIAFIALLFCILQWPGGHGMMCKLVPSLIAIFFVLLAIYVFLFGALKSLADKGVNEAKHLQKTEGTAFIFIALLIIGCILHSMHIPGGGQLVMLSCYTLAIISALIAVWVTIIINKKK